MRRVLWSSASSPKHSRRLVRGEQVQILHLHLGVGTIAETAPSSRRKTHWTCRSPAQPFHESRGPAPRERVQLRHDLAAHFPHRPQVGIVGNGLVAELQLILGATPSPSRSCRRGRRHGRTRRHNPPTLCTALPCFTILFCPRFWSGKTTRRVEKRVAGKNQIEKRRESM